MTEQGAQTPPPSPPRPVTVAFLLPWPDAATAAQRDDLRRTAGGPVSEVLMDYDHGYDDEGLAGPMDVLGQDAVDAAFERAFAQRAAFGETLPAELAETASAWLPAPTPMLIQLHKAVALVRAVLERPGVAAYAVLGSHPAFPWYRTVIHRVAAACGIMPVAWQGEEAAACREIDPAWPGQEIAEAAAVVPAAPQRVARATDDAEGLRSATSDFVAGRKHVVVVMRLRSMVSWRSDPLTGAALRSDPYNELYMERLAGLCQANGWAMTVLSLDGESSPDEGGISLEALYPGVVREVVPAPRYAGQIPAAAEAIRGQKALAQFIADGGMDPYLSVDGIPFHDCFAAPRLTQMLDAYRTCSGAHAARWGIIFDALNPAVVVGGRLDSYPALVRAARRKGVPVASIRFGVGNEMLVATMPGPAASRALQPDLHLMWGQGPAEFLRQFEKDGRVLGPGRPRNDAFVLTEAADARAAVRAKLGFPDDSLLVTVGFNSRTRFAELPRSSAGQSIVSPRTVAQCLAALHRLNDRLDGRLRLALKPHGREDEKVFAEAARSLPGGFAAVLDMDSAVKGLHNADLLGASDLLLINPSSMLAEAVSCGVPCVMLTDPGARWFFDSARISIYGAMGRHVESVDALAEATFTLLTDPGERQAELARARQGVERHFGPLDGRNAERTAASIAGFLEGTAPPPVPEGSPGWRAKFFSRARNG